MEKTILFLSKHLLLSPQSLQLPPEKPGHPVYPSPPPPRDGKALPRPEPTTQGCVRGTISTQRERGNKFIHRRTISRAFLLREQPSHTGCAGPLGKYASCGRLVRHPITIAAQEAINVLHGACSFREGIEISVTNSSRLIEGIRLLRLGATAAAQPWPSPERDH